MHKPDFDRFRALLNNLASMYGRKPPDDELLQSYWRALRDLPLELVEQGVQYHMRYGKHFPRPVELRPRDDKPTGAPEGGDSIALADRAAERWAERVRGADDPLQQAALQEAAWARKLTTTDESHPAYREILRLARLAADRHLALLTKRPLLVRVK